MPTTMWPQAEQEEDAIPKSSITCHTCRRRKVKCGRELPFCTVCVETNQFCNYPDRAMKPGPKIGSFQRSKRRRTKTQSQSKSDEPQWGSEEACSPTEEQDDRENRDRSSSGEPNGRRPPRPCPDSTAEHVPAPARRPSHSRTQRTSSMSTKCHNQGDEQEASCRRGSQLNMHDLSFILHPSHEASTPDKEHSTAGESPPCHSGKLYLEACSNLGVTPQSMEKLIQIYFDNMVAINLFHKPSFQESLKNITSIAQLCAVLAAIASYSVRFVSCEGYEDLQTQLMPFGTPTEYAPTTFVGVASRYIDLALAECNDEPPSLRILQALILATHCRLTQGVRGTAWRSLGMCVRLAYELNFHLLDLVSQSSQGDDDAERWSLNEEKRRAWWAIWEMDVFASTIRRTPTALDWSQMEVLLPAPDTNWYRNVPVASCFFQQDPRMRWRVLHESKNKSAKAWFIIINSLMKDAQVISCPRGVPAADDGNDQHYESQECRNSQRRSSGPSQQYPEDEDEARQKLETLANSVHCFVKTMPDNLRYQQQHLSFLAPVPGQVESHRQLHCSIYNIYVMTQLARLMIHRYDVFRGQIKAIHSGSQSGAALGKRKFTAAQEQEAMGLQQYFEASDNILSIINRSCETHIRYINPFLSSTIWLAAAVQLVRKQFDEPTTRIALVKTRFDVLYITYKQCVSFWGTQTAMQQNLEAIELQLEGLKSASVDSKPATSPVLRKSTWSSMPQRRRWIPMTPDASRETVANGPGMQNLMEESHAAASMGHINTVLGTGGSSSKSSRQNFQKEGLETEHGGMVPFPPSGALPNTPPATDVGKGSTGDRADLSMLSTNRSQVFSRNPEVVNAEGTMVPGESGAPGPSERWSQDAMDGVQNMSMLDFMMQKDFDQDFTANDQPSMNMWSDVELPSNFCDVLSGVASY